MKSSGFFLGAVLGAAAAVALSKKFLNCCSCEENTDACENPVIKEAEKEASDAVEKLRNSVDSLRKELNSRIESEQTFAAKCEDLKEQVAKQSAEINNLKNVCEMQDSRNKKLEEELAGKK